jgi:hypothetical protein
MPELKLRIRICSRTQIEVAIEDSPSLRSNSAEKLEESYQRARRQIFQVNLYIILSVIRLQYNTVRL